MTQTLEEMKKKYGLPLVMDMSWINNPNYEDTIYRLIEQVWNARGEEVVGKREAIAEIEHEQWIAWSKNIADTENITPTRLERWKELWRPYDELTEAEKDQDREWADKVIATITPKPLERFGFEPRYPNGIPEDTTKVSNDN